MVKLDGPEFIRRQTTAFSPAPLSLKPGQLYAAVPKHLFERSTVKSMLYILRHAVFAVVFWLCARRIEGATDLLCTWAGWEKASLPWRIIEWLLWTQYWIWQGIVFTGFWVLGHEAGHDALSPSARINEIIGLVLHTALLTPYHAWRLTHRTHHKKTNNLHHDETHLPWLRSDFKLPPEDEATHMDYKHMVEETPAFTLFRLVIRQFIGFQGYLLMNRKGNPKYYGTWTSHYDPNAKLFKPRDHNAVVVSDICIILMISVLSYWGFQVGGKLAWRMYWVPWFWTHNWIVTFTYLQHADPTIPYYRENEWTFLRGALCTVDRPVFGWIGRFFWFGVAHDHVAHHIFASVPFYHLPEVTEAIKPVLGEHYLYDSTPTFYALWRSFTQCQFVENEGDIVFFKDQNGESRMRLKGHGDDECGEAQGTDSGVEIDVDEDKMKPDEFLNGDSNGKRNTRRQADCDSHTRLDEESRKSSSV